MNKVILMGRLTRDPDVRYSAGENSTAVARYTLAVDRRFRRDGGQPRYDRIFDGHLAEVIDKLNNYLYDDYDDGGKSA